MALTKLLERRRISHNKIKDILESLDYMPHPALPGGRVNNPVPVEGGKPRLYVRAGHINAQILEPARVRSKYMEDQNYTAPEQPNQGGIVNHG